MSYRLGTIYKLHRIEKNKTLRKVAETCSISASKLSDFENNKIKISEKMLRVLYSALNMQLQLSTTAYAEVEHIVLNLYYDIAYMRGTEHKKLRALILNKEIFQYNEAYIPWLLGRFVFMVYHPEHDFDYEISVIAENESCLTSDLRQIFYDTMGVYLKNLGQNHEAQKYFNRGIRLSVSDTTLGMLLYHKSMVLRNLGEISRALDCITKARKLFDQELNQKRQIVCNIELGGIYTRLNRCKEAERVYNHCIHAIHNNSVSDVIVIYKSLVWNGIIAEQYEKALFYAKEASKISSRYAGSMNFYRSYASWKLGRISDAKEYIKTAKQFKLGESDYMMQMIDAFSAFLSKFIDVEKKERKLLKAYQEAIKVNDLQFQVFVLLIMIQLDFPADQMEKEIVYRDMIIDILHRQQ